MTATTTSRLWRTGGVVPAMGDIPLATNTLVYSGTMVARDASGNGVAPTDGDGLPIMGVAKETYDNRTGAPAGGTAGDLDAHVMYGVFGFALSGATPLPGAPMYSVDNQTVSADGAGGTRGLAGYLTEYRDSVAYVWMGPHVAGQMGVADALSEGFWEVPLNSFRLSTGAALAAFSDGATDGFELSGSEALSIRYNPSILTAIATSIALPPDLDGAADLVVNIRCSRVGTSDVTAAVTVGAFFQVDGTIYTGDADAGGASSAVATNSQVQTVTRTIAAADVPAGASTLTLVLTPTAALDADDLLIHSVYLTGARLPA